METLADIGLLAFDLDGTLLRDDKTVSSRTLAALAACRARGIRLSIATGRAVCAAEKYRAMIGAAGPQIYYNGAEVVEMPEANSKNFSPNGNSIHSRFLNADSARASLEIARRSGAYFQLYFPAGLLDGFAGEPLLVEKVAAETEYYSAHSGVLAQAGDVEAALDAAHSSGVIKGLFIIQDAEKMAAVRAALAERLGDAVYIVNSSPVYLEVLAKGVNKGAGLEVALRHLGLKRENCVAFGDEENDLPLFAAAGFSCAPANAKGEAKKAATFVIPSNEDDGVAAFVEEKILAVC